MGQDFVARKAAKKQRKRQARDAETGRKSKRKRKEDGFEVADDDGLGMTAEQVKRKRKKGNNVSLRISRALCYKPPQLTAEDLQWDGTAEGGEDDGRGNNPYSFNDMAEAGYDSDVEEALQKQPQQQQQKQPTLKLSTAVNLLDPAAAAKLAGKKQPKQQQQAGGKAGQQQPQQQLDDAVAAAPALQGLVDSGLNPLVARCMAKLGFTEPTPIQSACWGPACAGQDVLGHAEPGSGKTLAYLLPAFAHLAASSRKGQSQQQAQQDEGEAAVQPRVLVLLPSRELAQQVHSQCTALFSVTGVSSAVLYGGVPKEQQVDILQRRQPQLIVATPGRLLDLLDSGVLNFAGISCAVLDEADKMLSVGFEPQLQRLKALLLERHAGAAQQDGAGGSSKLKGTKHSKKQKQQGGISGGVPAPAVSSRCQVLLFSATLPKAVRQTADAWLARGYKAVSCSAGADSISQTITQVVQVCAEHKKPAKLLKHLAAIKEASQGLRNPPRVLVFANRIKTVLFVHRTLTEAGYRAVMLHGKRSQPERDAAVAGFKAGKAQVLVASDVASRGLDIRGLPYVVNYDFPSNLEVYIHRVGRTGRLAAAGHAFSFFTRPLAKLAAPLVDLLRAHNQAVDPNLLQLSEAWAQAEAALAAQGKSPAALEAAAAAAADGQAEEEEEEEGEDGKLEAGAAVLPEDLQEGLLEEQRAALVAAAGNNTTSSALQQQQQQQSKRASKKHAGDALMVPQGPSSTGAAAGNSGGNAATDQTTAAAAAAPPFIPAPKFAGAKVGYAFKKGPRGVGYYVDPVQQKQLAKQQQKQARKQEHQKVLQQALKQYKQQQQHGQQGEQAAAAGNTQAAAANKGSSRGADAAAANKSKLAAVAGGGSSSSSSKPSTSELPPLPGLAKKLPAFMTSGDLSDDDGGDRVLDRGGSGSGSGSGSDDDNDDDSDEEMQGGRGGSLQQRLQRAGISSSGGGGNKRRKALPGRLRKKLAKDAAGGGAAGGKKGPGGKKGGAGKKAGAKSKSK